MIDDETLKKATEAASKIKLPDSSTFQAFSTAETNRKLAEIAQRAFIPQHDLWNEEALSATRQLSEQPNAQWARIQIPSNLQLDAAIQSLQNAAFAAAQKVNESFSKLAKQHAETWKNAAQSFSGISRHFTFLKAIEESTWPIHFSASEELIDELVNLWDDSRDEDSAIEKIDSLVFEHYTNDVLSDIVGEWDSAPLVDIGTLSIMNSAFGSYTREDYFGCCSMLMCLIGGLIDRLFLLYSSAADIDDEILKLYSDLKNEGKPVGKNPKHIKARLFFLVFSTEGAPIYWNSAHKYLSDIILTSKDDWGLQQRAPLRNKICHGIQTNYGTKLHALKSLLTIDLIITLMQEITEVLESNSEMGDRKVVSSGQ